MQSKATTVKQYLDELLEDRKEPITKLRQQILDNLPKGVEETMSYGMLGYVIPHSVYPQGYHCNTKLPLPFMNLASQKNFIAVYSMVIYSKQEVMDWFTVEYAKRCKYKLDMGKSRMRFKKMDDIPFDLIGELTAKVSAEEWINIYETTVKN
ncbi:DUF1801 domain-containing protein [Algibacter amylolyticus]|uniref:DUF1801 domain-containing protein n=1 Tax=Algibacter amylolyticus TaxID=1608400 RepID=A0A5M7BGT7_9FLAO|nr:DUF1801 domain-containing protein [Algibacter amylolyticus]KAA5827627.1 DUF1801 domain-containing protein [Algibacter amylolyticus]MBB5266840.1 uncharacterized protein YdhG (YjbR/CyaY superfamily) [Algibacter amylolyticus]TSJ81872.1 DUF1801 domain-containing protein [Algibacter amylolyticus]